MAIGPKDRGPRLTVLCFRCGRPARLKNVEIVMFSEGVQEAIYKCDCGDVMKRVVPREKESNNESHEWTLKETGKLKGVSKERDAR